MEMEMAEWLKRGATAETQADSDRHVRDAVEAILTDIEARCDVRAAIPRQVRARNCGGTSKVIDGGWTAN
jgi:hypothetical protein